VLDTNATANSDTFSLALEEVSTVPGPCASYITHSITGSIGETSWTDVRLTVQLEPGTMAGGAPVAMASVSFGGQPGLHETQLCMNFAPTQAGLGIGSIYKSDPMTTWENRYDNVSLDMAASP
jgi:hypothetical protein